MSQEIEVYIQLKGENHLVGHLYFHSGRNHEACSFEYGRTWLGSPCGFSIDPALPLSRDTFHTIPNQSLFACFSDCSPDRWGRTLMVRKEAEEAKVEKRAPYTLREKECKRI